jgi:sulfate permease, SulP family
MTSTPVFTPKLVSVWREGYHLAHLRADAIAGLTVAIVALPLSMAIAIASHAPPEAGLYTAIVGGFLISALGGSRYQIGGPAGAFIVLVASIIDMHGLNGLLLATLMAGFIMLAAGLLRAGNLIRLVPHPVIVGFSAGIAIIIFVSQLKDIGGLTLGGVEPAALIPKLRTLYHAMSTFSVPAFTIALLTVTVIVLQRLYRPNWPGFLIALGIASIANMAFGMGTETIASRFGGLPHGLPMPSLPDVSLEKLTLLLPSALSLALLGSIESLLSAAVADNMKGRKHRSNAELVAQGFANIGCSLFGGITATGTIARTATNVRAGAHGPVSGILHALFVLLFLIVAAPLAEHIPLAALAGLLAVVAWNMVEVTEIKKLFPSWQLLSVFLATLTLTVFHDLIAGILAGTILFYVFQFFSKRSSRTIPHDTETTDTTR